MTLTPVIMRDPRKTKQGPVLGRSPSNAHEWMALSHAGFVAQTAPPGARRKRLATSTVGWQTVRVIRKAFKMWVNPTAHAEYERRHRPIWQEMEDMLREHGVLDYSLFLDPETNTLFAVVDIESEERWATIASTDVCRRWWKSMRDLMSVNADDSPRSAPLREVFRLGEG